MGTSTEPEWLGQEGKRVSEASGGQPCESMCLSCVHSPSRRTATTSWGTAPQVKYATGGVVVFFYWLPPLNCVALCLANCVSLWGVWWGGTNEPEVFLGSP